MANIFNVARYILDKRGAMLTWKLQKICYYNQTWSLAWTEKPIFGEDFEAWSNGPVCPELARLHKEKFTISAENIYACLCAREDPTEDQRETIDCVLKGYGDSEPYELREQCHNELPWKNARGDFPDFAPCHTVISKTRMGGILWEFIIQN